MTTAELKKSHDAMARFIIALCRYSDSNYPNLRTETTQRNYEKGRRLIERAGFKYKLPKADL